MNTNKIITEFEKFISIYYAEKINRPDRTWKKHIVVDFNKLMKFNPHLAELILDEPHETLKLATIAAERTNPDIQNIDFLFRFKNIGKHNKVEIGELRSEHIGKMVSVEGVIKQKSDVKPQVTSTIYECPSCGSKLSVLQTDENKLLTPTLCTCGRRSKFRVISEKKIDAYSLMIEEPLDIVDGRSRLKQIRILCRRGLSDKRIEKQLNQGKKVELSGELRQIRVKDKHGVVTTHLDWFLEANYISFIDENPFSDVKITKSDIELMKKEAKDNPNILDDISQSIFNDIYKYDQEKKGITLQMVGGVAIPEQEVRGNFHILLVGDPGCVGEGTLITMADGTFRRIENFGKKHLEEINQKVKINRMNPYDNYNGKTKTFFKYKNMPTKIIKTQLGKEIVCSHNHPFLIKEKGAWQKPGKWVFKKAEELQEGDRIKTIPITNCSKRELVPFGDKYCDNGVALLMGYALGDGCVHKSNLNCKSDSRLTLYVNESEKEIIKPISSIIEESFNYNPKIYQRKPKKENKINGRKINSTQKITHLIINSCKISELFKFVREKKVPDEILASPDHIVASFLKGLFQADGCVFVAKNKDRSDKIWVQLKSVNKRLLQDVQTLLTKFGIQARINQDNLCIKRTLDVQLFECHIGFWSNNKIKTLEKIRKLKINTNRKRINKEKIISIREGKPRTVYDIEVEKYHRFISDGLVSHNSAKSAMLKIAQKFAPKSQYVVGVGVSAAGLTAAVVRDDLIGGFTLEAGALPLNNNGLLCIDELDKIGDEHKDALHEPLEQQTVSISKASVQSTLIARTSVLAAANPKHGSYSEYDHIYTQINLKDTLIDRFDFVYPIKESKLSTEDHDKVGMIIFGRGEEDKTEDERKPPKYGFEFIKKYLTYAKSIKPKLPLDVRRHLAHKYCELKNCKSEGKQRAPVTGRTANAMKRVSQAIAKIRLHDKITIEDAEIAYDMIEYSLIQMGVNPESGEYVEQDFISGKKFKKKDLMARICNLIADKGIAEHEYLIEVLKTEGYKDDMVISEALSYLKKNGDITEPRNGRYKVM